MRQAGQGRGTLANERKRKVENAVFQLQAVGDIPTSSVRQIAQLSSIPSTSAHRIMGQQLNLKPFHMQVTQAATEEDKNLRPQFASSLLEQEQFIPNILWRDEAYFSLDGVVNRHKCVIWSKGNPHHTISQSLHSPQLCVWMGLSANCILTPFFFDGTLAGDHFLEMLRDHTVPQLHYKL